MRYRKKHGMEEKLISYKNIFISDYKAHKGSWSTVFGNDNPIHIEIGCGRGKFITTLAQNNININYIAIEKLDGIIIDTVKKIDEKELKNVRAICMDVFEIEEVFDKEELERVYLNFSDPWPKKRHFKRRLTYRGFLEKYTNVLKSYGEIHFKTDNRDLFEFSLNEFCDFGLKLKNISLDLHKEEEISKDITTTEYEDKFKSLGMNIYRLEGFSWNKNL